MKGVFYFTLGKYFNYVLQFVRGILIASIFDYQQYAIWGVVMFWFSYYTLIGFGIPQIILTRLKDYEPNDRESAELIGSSIVWLLGLGVFYLLGTYFLDIIFDILNQPAINYYHLIVLAILYLSLEALKNTARYNKLFTLIWLVELITILPLLIFLILRPVEITIENALLTLIVSSSLSLILLARKIRIKINHTIIKGYLKEIYKTGIPLLLFTYASYFLFVILRYFVLESYDDKTIANFNFAWMIANALMIGLNVVNWYFYPTLLKNISKGTWSKAIHQREFFLVLFGISLLVMALLPSIFELLVNNFFSKYEGAIFHFKYLLLSQMLFYLTFYPSSYFIALEKNKTLVIVGVSTAALYMCTVLVNLWVSENLDLTILYATLTACSVLYLISLNHTSNWKGAKTIFYLCISLIVSIGLTDNLWLKGALFVCGVVIMRCLWLEIKRCLIKLKYGFNHL